MDQISFDEMLYGQYKITTPIRLIELFGGIGSQAKALERLGANFEHYRLVEFDKYCIASYNAVHETNFEPMDITKTHASDLGIENRDLLTYLLTYSFPCTDLSMAGKRKGMSKGSGTRSGLLWEVERILNECGNDLPQVLLMENVKAILSEQTIGDFKEWMSFLRSKGYSNYYDVLNSKDYGIPQNRERCFMVSILGEAFYEFPKPVKLKLKLKDMLEDEVPEKYFLSNKQVKEVSLWNSYEKPLKSVDNKISKTLTTRCGAYCAGMQLTYDTLKIKNATKQGYLEAQEGDGVDISSRMDTHRGTVQKDMIQTIKATCDVGVVVPNMKAQLCNELIEKGAVKEGDVIRHSYTTARMNGKMNDIKEKNISPTLDTRCDCLGITTKERSNSLRIRKLTPKECWRLMGFDDEDFDKAEQVNSNAQLYKQAGNSIVVNVLEAIFKQML